MQKLTALVLPLVLLACSDDDPIQEPAGATCAAVETAKAPACDTTTLLEAPQNRAERGPWPVGARRVDIDGLPAEVWYPARSSTACPKPHSYDIREQLPASEAKKIPDSENPFQQCDCYADLSLDADHGPYPVVVMVHGLAGFRTLSLGLQTHWASRGFVVVAADHPGVRLRDLMLNLTGQPTGITADQAGDLRRMLAALRDPKDDLGFLRDKIDPSRVALIGHSAGGGAISALGDEAGVRLLAPMCSGGTKSGPNLESTLVLGAELDQLVAFGKQTSAAYDTSPKKKRLVGVGNAGHSLPTELCLLGADRGGILQIALDNGVEVPGIIATLAKDGCQTGRLDAEQGLRVVQSVTSLALEESLLCSSAATTALAQIQTTHPEIIEFREEL